MKGIFCILLVQVWLNIVNILIGTPRDQQGTCYNAHCFCIRQYVLFDISDLCWAWKNSPLKLLTRLEFTLVRFYCVMAIQPHLKLCVDVLEAGYEQHSDIPKGN